MYLSHAEFETVVANAVDLLPEHFAELMSNLVVQVEEAPDARTLRELGLDPRERTLLGLYTGVPLDQRGGGYGNVLPDVIVLYRRSLLAMCPTRQDLLRQVQLTLLHEIGHHFGMSDAEMQVWEQEFHGLDR